MKRLLIAGAVVLAGLPNPLLAHAGLDRSSTVMVSLHSMAHAINDHPFLVALLAALVIGGLGLYQWKRGRHRSP